MPNCKCDCFLYDSGDHAESVVIHYDPSITSYDDMLEIFWEIHDPTKPPSEPTPQYMSAIFYYNDHQKELAEKSREEHQELFSMTIMTKILPANVYYLAEE